MTTQRTPIMFRLASLATAALMTMVGLGPAVSWADDTEALFPPPNLLTPGAPNILFIFDTSASMATLVTGLGDPDAPRPPSYSAAVNFASDPNALPTGCQKGRIYWIPEIDLTNGSPKSCAGLPYIQTDLTAVDTPSLNKLSCKLLQDYFRDQSATNNGMKILGQVAQWDDTGWKALDPAKPNLTTDCWVDSGIHGLTSTSLKKHFAANATIGGDGYFTFSGAKQDKKKLATFPAGSYVFFDGNKIAYDCLYDPEPGPCGAGVGGAASTRIEVVKDALAAVLDSISGVNVGLMRIANNGSQVVDPDDSGRGSSAGGMVVHEVASLEGGGKESILYTLYEGQACEKNKPDNCRQIMIPGGRKALGETMYEAYRYLAGLQVVHGDQTKIEPLIDFPSVDGSVDNPPTDSSSIYKSPITEANCGKTYLVILSDGLTEQDNSDDSAIEALPNFRDLPGVENPGKASAKCDPDDVRNGPTGSSCVDDLPGWMWLNDVNTNVPGIQNVKTFTIGFDLANDDIGRAAEEVLRSAAVRGGGDFFNANSKAELTDIFTEIVRKVLFENAVFTAPAVTVNAFNRTQNLESLYFSVFKPNETSYRWIGNVKKYRLDPASGVVMDSDGRIAVDVSQGYFTDGTKSYWSATNDGADAAKGGAASHLDKPASRKILYNTKDTNDSLTELSSLKDSASAADAETMLFGGTAPAGSPTVSELVDWAYGYNIPIAPTEARADMGDPLHSRPATVIYGGSTTAPETIVFVTTNDGMLHAVDDRGAIDDGPGTELWAFMPRQMARRLPDLYQNDGVAKRTYGLDGSIRVYRKDVNHDGEIVKADGDRVYLYFGMRRGGYHYFGLDVTEPSAPRLMWRIGKEDGDIDAASGRILPDIGQTWSMPAVARVNVDRIWTDNPDKLVLIFGGGYDVKQDNLDWSQQQTGNGLYMVDAISGKLIWRATGPAVDQGSAQLVLNDMRQSIPADIAVADLSNDGFADRMYASDLGGRVWRFDIMNGESPASLVKGGLFASIGLGEGTNAPSPDPNPNNRRFYFAPDISVIECGGRRWLNVAIGSGNRELPVTDNVTENRFYSLRDGNIFAVLENGAYKTACSTADLAAGPCHQIIRDNDVRLVDITAMASPVIPVTSVGWKIDLSAEEKVLAEARTFQNNVLFTSYTPTVTEVLSCSVKFGLNRFYALNACSAQPAFDNNRDGTVSGIADRSLDVPFAGIAPEIVVAFPPCGGSGEGCRITPRFLMGPVSVGSGNPVRPVRTFWRQNAVR